MNEVSSSYYRRGVDSYKDPLELSKEKRPINKSPILYLRRKRNLAFPSTHSPAEAYPAHGEYIWCLGNQGIYNSKIDPDYKVDKGDIYPNHSSAGRFGQPEWVKFRDYVRNNVKWIKQNELVID